MSYIRKLLTGADEQTRTLDAVGNTVEIREAPGAGPRFDLRPPEPAPMIVRVAETYLKAHENYTVAELNLTHKIDALVEERRQMRVAINSTVNGLYPLQDDPALSDEMKKRIAATFNNAVRVTIDDADLT